MQGQSLLAVGIAAIVALLGYMGGGSATLAVAIAVPPVLGLVMTAVGLMQASQPSKEMLELVSSR